ncbi:short-chain dehydrogenase [Fomitiporia mediterranea MF3/22]|uniref:short-chain dehydrogenase n=1 Tax=Fomitiporia mediterranea (strain MF3/22) TaxID=694068 RepID=UPI0004407741|nr:short-chain dehydrogenase [Fomitiporia mediterranea MF3/22]EJD01105.1 short-chain dehydrogenase [Fomitiporia mediterranea MF3/22]
MAEQRKHVVLVTGASKGIGLAATRHLLETFNAIVVAVSRSRSPELLELLKKYPSALLSIEADITNEAATRDAIALAIKTYRNLDGLILNAGVVEPMGLIRDPEITTESWRRHFDVNFFSLLYTVQAALPALRSSDLRGRIIFISSGAATGGTPAWGVYNASKAAMNSFCRTLANEEPDIVSIALRPGMVDTAMQAQLRNIGASKLRDEDAQKFIRAHAEGQLVKPEDVGHVIAALSLRAPKSLSGQFVNWNSDECKEFRRS